MTHSIEKIHYTLLCKFEVFYCANLRLAIRRYSVEGFRRCDCMSIPGESEPLRLN